MTDLEMWSVFFQYAANPKYRKIVNSVIESKEALQMAGNVLMSISQDELRSRRMYQSDMDSNIATAEARGKREGRNEGLRKGRQDGIQERESVVYI